MDHQWRIRQYITFFVLVDPYSLNAVKGYGSTKIKKVLINYDVIDGPRCDLWMIPYILKGRLELLIWYMIYVETCMHTNHSNCIGSCVGHAW